MREPRAKNPSFSYINKGFSLYCRNPAKKNRRRDLCSLFGGAWGSKGSRWGSNYWDSKGSRWGWKGSRWAQDLFTVNTGAKLAFGRWKYRPI